ARTDEAIAVRVGGDVDPGERAGDVSAGVVFGERGVKVENLPVLADVAPIRLAEVERDQARCTAVLRREPVDDATEPSEQVRLLLLERGERGDVADGLRPHPRALAGIRHRRGDEGREELRV